MHYKGNKPAPSVLAIYKEMILFGRTCTSGLGPRIAQYRLYHGARTQKVFHLAQVTGKVGKKMAHYSPVTARNNILPILKKPQRYHVKEKNTRKEKGQKKKSFQNILPPFLPIE